MRGVIKQLLRLAPVMLITAVLVTPSLASVSVSAQTSGGTIIEGNAGDPKNLNPVLVSDAPSQQLVSLMFPTFVGVDPKSATIQPNAPGGLAESWKVSDDGKTYTFTLRKNWKWTDGQPITAKDVEYTFAATADPQVKAYGSFTMSVNGGTIDSVKALDDYTVEVKYNTADCKALNNVGVGVIPAHVFKPDHSDIATSPFSTNPSVSAGVFQFKEFVPSQRVTLVANPNYPDATGGTVKPDGYIFKVVKDANVDVDQFLAGESNVIDGPPIARRAEIKANANVATPYDFPGNVWDYMGYNLADPKNPQPAFDKDGKAIDQGHHPIFGDVAVRQAIAHAVDVPSMIKTIELGQATQMPSAFIPSSWAFDKTLEPIGLDAKAAGDMLDKAGWPMGADGIRAAKGAKYAPDGTPLRFTVLVAAEGTTGKKIAAVLKTQLKAVGIDVVIQTEAFDSILDTINHETFDAYLGAWQQGFPDDPDYTQLFDPHTDTVDNSTSNYMSYNNPTLNDLMKKAVTLPGCKQEDRAALYHQIGKIIQDDQPYLFLFAPNGEYAVSKKISGFAPYPAQLFWNVDTWTIAQ